jgi:hypothetical protein
MVEFKQIFSFTNPKMAPERLEIHKIKDADKSEKNKKGLEKRSIREETRESLEIERMHSRMIEAAKRFQLKTEMNSKSIASIQKAR